MILGEKLQTLFLDKNECEIERVAEKKQEEFNNS